MRICPKWLRRKRTLVFICVILTVLSLLQFCLFILFSPKAFGIPDNHGRSSSRSEDHMKTFLTKCSQHSLIMVAVDTHVLKKSTPSTSKLPRLCPPFCFDAQKVATFVVFQELYEQRERAFFDDLLAEGFHRVTIEDSDPKLPNVTLKTHHVIGKGHVTVHLVMFHDRPGNFWWHGKLINQLTQGQPLRREFPELKPIDFHFGSEQGAYEKFDIRPVRIEEVVIYLPQSVNAFLNQTATSMFIACNHTTEQRFLDEYGWTSQQPSALFRKAALKALSSAKKVLDSLGVPFWLSSGTCLGFYRQCDLISYSRDVDIGIFIRDYDPRIVETFIRRGFRLKLKLGKIEDSLELSFVIAGIKLDIFFFYEEDDHMWNGGLQVKSGNKFKYIFPKFTLCWTEFLDLKVRIPCQTRQYVEANYGLNWFEPILDWDWKSSPSNVQENGRWTPDEWLEVIQQFNVD